MTTPGDFGKFGGFTSQSFPECQARKGAQVKSRLPRVAVSKAVSTSAGKKSWENGVRNHENARVSANLRGSNIC